MTHDCPWVGPCQCFRDASTCTCGHPSVSHASTTHIGDGPCGQCPCVRFDNFWKEAS